VKALGVTQPRWVSDYFRMDRDAALAALRQLEQEDVIGRVTVDGWTDDTFVHGSNRDLAENAAAGVLRPKLTTVLSPFDPLVWDRARARAVFGFDYSLECYTPAPKRKYGYFVLPILRRGRLIGRLDAKAHRREGIFEVKALYLENGLAPAGALVNDVARALAEVASWHGTPEVRIRRSSPASLAKLVRSALRSGATSDA
jgi:hypothetical protein